MCIHVQMLAGSQRSWGVGVLLVEQSTTPASKKPSRPAVAISEGFFADKMPARLLTRRHISSQRHGSLSASTC